MELRKTQTERGTAGGSRSSFPLTIDSTTTASSSSLRLQCDAIPTRRGHRKSPTALCCTLKLGRRSGNVGGRLHLVIKRDDWLTLVSGRNYRHRLVLGPFRVLCWTHCSRCFVRLPTEHREKSHQASLNNDSLNFDAIAVVRLVRKSYVESYLHIEMNVGTCHQQRIVSSAR